MKADAETSDPKATPLVRQTLRDAAVGVGVADSARDLGVIKRPGVAAAIWRRQPTATFQAWISGLQPDALPCGRIALSPHRVHEALSVLCDRAGTPADAERQWLIDDIASLVQVFAGLMRAPALRLRLDVVATTMCPKFHIDAVTARLICTYRGPGTQYGISTDGGEPKRVFAAATGEPIILRGTLWPDGPPSGLLHRSPPVHGADETRLVLVLDEARPERSDRHV